MARKTNTQIARILREFALAYEAEGVRFKPQAYEIAAKTVEELPEELAVLYKKCGEECIDDLEGIGEAITKKIVKLVTVGKLPEYDALKKKYPFDILALTKIEGVGPKTAVTLYKKLKIKTRAQLEKAAKAGKIAKLSGFGKKTEQNILEGLGFLKSTGGRKLLSEGLRRAEEVTAAMKKSGTVKEFDACGSVRRRKETIGDLDFICTATDAERAIAAFKKLPQVKKVLEEGENRIFVRFNFNMDGDLLVLKPEEYGSALVHFTGSKEHNIKIRSLAVKKKMKLSEFGLFKGKKRVAGKTEASIYKALGMQTPPPEMREDRGEVEAARKKKLPKVIPYGSIKGDLQVQTNWTDGEHSIAEMAKAAKKAGLSYMAVTDHTKALAVTGGLDEKKLAKQAKEIDALNKKMKGFRILKSAEINVLKDGKLDISDEALKKLDIVSVAVHSHFSMTQKEMTDRILTALKHPSVQILFHPTGRLINKRPAYKLDIGKIVRAAKQYKVALEVNAYPERLDLNDAHIRLAVEEGVKLVIDSDAHHVDHFQYIDLGVAQARRGWAKKSDVLNTLSASELLKRLKK